MSSVTDKAKQLAKQGVAEPLTPSFSAKDYSIFFMAGALCCTAYVPGTALTQSIWLTCPQLAWWNDPSVDG